MSRKKDMRYLHGRDIVNSLLESGRYSSSSLKITGNDLENHFGCANYFDDVVIKIRAITLNQAIVDNTGSCVCYVDGSAAVIGEGISSSGGGGAVIMDENESIKSVLLVGLQASEYTLGSTHSETLSYLAARYACEHLGMSLENIYTDGEPSVVAHLSAVGCNDVGPINWCKGHDNFMPNEFADKLATYAKSMSDIDNMNERDRRRQNREKVQRIRKRPKFTAMEDIGVDQLQDVDFIVTPFGSEYKKSGGTMNRLIVDVAPLSETEMGIITMELMDDAIIEVKRRKCPRNQISTSGLCQALIDEAWDEDNSDVQVELGHRFMTIYNDVVNGDNIKWKCLDMVDDLARKGIQPIEQKYLQEQDIANIVTSRRSLIQSTLNDIEIANIDKANMASMVETPEPTEPKQEKRPEANGPQFC